MAQDRTVDGVLHWHIVKGPNQCGSDHLWLLDFEGEYSVMRDEGEDDQAD